MTVAITGVHPYADKYPMLPESELIELAESIAANGLRSPVVVTPDGLILDGRNRAAACEQAGVTPETAVYEGDDLAEYVIDVNTARRHMSTGARAMSTALVLAADGRRKDGRWARGSVQNGNGDSSTSAWIKAVQNAGVVIDWMPALAAEVTRGDVPLDAAFRQADDLRRSKDAEKVRAREVAKREREEAKEAAERNAQIVADLTVAESRYVELVENGTLTPAAAWAAHQEDTRKERDRIATERRDAEKSAGGVARAVMCLHAALVHDDARGRFLDREWPLGYLGASPAARDRMTPQHFRDIADALEQLATTWRGTPDA